MFFTFIGPGFLSCFTTGYCLVRNGIDTIHSGIHTLMDAMDDPVSSSLLTSTTTTSLNSNSYSSNMYLEEEKNTKLYVSSLSDKELDDWIKLLDNEKNDNELDKCKVNIKIKDC